MVSKFSLFFYVAVVVGFYQPLPSGLSFVGIALVIIGLGLVAKQR
ncbi:hypothetical protein [Moraxella osloensis]|nr:hypothetical protein [Moraxella osloensis]